MSVNAYEKIFAGYADPDAGYPNADPDSMLLNLNTSNADTDADLCIIFLCLEKRGCYM